MDRHTTLPSGREAGYFLYQLEENGIKKAKSLVTTLLNKYTLRLDYNADGLAYMNHASRTIVVNPIQYLANIDPMYEKLLPNGYDWKLYHKWIQFISGGFVGIVCHEIGHALYTIAPSESEQIVKSLGTSTPDYFIHFCSNVVEDSYIQNKMKDRFRWNLVRDGITISTSMFQGFTTCEEFKEKKEFSVHDKLFYFILKSYNPTFEQPKGLDIPEELVEEFLSFYFFSDLKERFVATVGWADKMYEYLKDEIKNENEQQQQSQQGSQGQQGDQGTGSGVGKGVGKGPNTMTEDEIAQAIKDMVDQLSQSTGVGSGSQKSSGNFDPKESLNQLPTSTLVGACTGISKARGSTVEPLNSVAMKVKSDYDINFRRLQLHTYGGLTYNLPRGDLYKKKLYKADYSNKIFTRNLSKKRDMDLYFGITLDCSGSMSHTYYDLVDIIVPLIHSLGSLKSRSEMLVFSDETVKVKDYYDTNISNLYALTKASNQRGGTDLMPSLQYFASIIRERQHKDKCIIVVTDGATDNNEACAQAIKSLNSMGVLVIGIGLKIGRDCEWFKELFGGQALVYDSDTEIQNNIAKDLINILSNKFMRR